MRNPFFLCLLCSVGLANAATRAFDEGGTVVTNNGASFETSSISSGSAADVSLKPKESVAVVAVQPDHEKETFHTRRPYADQGIRYSSNDWLVNLITTPLS